MHSCLCLNYSFSSEAPASFLSFFFRSPPGSRTTVSFLFKAIALRHHLSVPSRRKQSVHRIVSFCPVDGFSRLIHTYTCSYGALNFNRSIIPVFSSTSYNLWLRKTDGPPVGEIDVPKVWDDILFLVHDCICIWLNNNYLIIDLVSPPFLFP